MRASKVGTIVELPDGRVGTTVYNGLDGVGIKWGRHTVTSDDIEGHGGCEMHCEPPPDYEWFPEAMLREPYKYADLPCVGEDFEILNDEDS